MLNVTNIPIMLSVILQNVVMLCHGACINAFFDNQNIPWTWMLATECYT
jgi:hypothetical protein